MASMRIHTFVEHYPVPYKPYYDAHFADLLHKGHDLTIFATGRMDRTVNEKVEQFGLRERQFSAHELATAYIAAMAGLDRMWMGRR